MKKYSVIIRGPLNNKSLQNIIEYRKDFNVIISHWENGNPSISNINGACDPVTFNKISYYEPKINNAEVQKLKCIVSDYPDIKVIENKYKDIRFKLMCNSFGWAWCNIYQFHSSIEGLKMCDTEFAICLRSDSSYPNLKPFINKLDNSPNKIITSNTIFRPDDRFKYHIGSHIVAGKTNSLKYIYDFCIKACKFGDSDMKSEINKILNISTVKIRQKLVFSGEQLMGCAIMFMHNEDFNKNNSKELMRKHVDIVKIDDLGDIEWQSSHYGDSKSNSNIPMIINSMDEL